MAQATLAETVHCILNQVAQNATTFVNLLATYQNTVPLFHISLLKLLSEHQPYLKRQSWIHYTMVEKQHVILETAESRNMGHPWLPGDFQQALMLTKPQMGTNREWGIFWLKALGWIRKVMPWTRLWPLQGSMQIQSLESHSLLVMLSSSFVTVQIFTVIPCSGNWLTLMFINLVQLSRKALWVCVCVCESMYLSVFSSLCQGAMMQQVHALMNPQCFVQHMQSKAQGFSICMQQDLHLFPSYLMHRTALHNQLFLALAYVS